MNMQTSNNCCIIWGMDILLWMKTKQNISFSLSLSLCGDFRKEGWKNKDLQNKQTDRQTDENQNLSIKTQHKSSLLMCKNQLVKPSMIRITLVLSSLVPN